MLNEVGDMGREDHKAESTHRPEIYEESALFLEVIAVDETEEILVVCIFWQLLLVLLEKEEMAKEEIVAWCDRLGYMSIQQHKAEG